MGCVMAIKQGILVLQEREEKNGASWVYFRTSIKHRFYNAYCAKFDKNAQRIAIYAAGNYIDIKVNTKRERIADIAIKDKCFGEIVENLRNLVQPFVPVGTVVKAVYEAFGLPLQLY